MDTDTTVDVPDGISGDWRVETFIVEKPSVYLLLKGRPITPGTYKRLMYKNTVVMSNTPAEVYDFMNFVWKARGNVLINGLGLGVVLKAVLQNPEVKAVTVIELSEDVIKLVAPTFSNDPRVTIIQADAFTWKAPRGMYYDAVWHDCWNNICETNLKEITKLYRKYGRRCSFQDAWSRDQLLRMR
jgi:spermidine synthase